MKRTIFSTATLISLLVMARCSLAMEHEEPKKHTKEYSELLEQVAKTLIVIEVLNGEGKPNHIKVDLSKTPSVLIQALVASKEVEQQERQYTQETFAPYFVHQTPEVVVIKTHVPGTYTIHIPENTPFEVNNPYGQTTIDPLLSQSNITKN